MAGSEKFDPLHPDLVHAQRRVVGSGRYEVAQSTGRSPLRLGWARVICKRPRQFGFRGDPYLLAELEDTLSLLARPPDVSVFGSCVLDCLEQLVGVSLPDEPDEMVRVERYPHGGMSGGVVCVPWWNDTMIPLLTQRFVNQANAPAL